MVVEIDEQVVLPLGDTPSRCACIQHTCLGLARLSQTTPMLVQRYGMIYFNKAVPYAGGQGVILLETASFTRWRVNT